MLPNYVYCTTFTTTKCNIKNKQQTFSHDRWIPLILNTQKHKKKCAKAS